MLRVDRLGDAADEEIERFVSRCPGTLIYTTPRFVRLLARELEATSAWLAARRDGAITGLLPYVARSGPLGPVFNSLAYFGSNGGVVQPADDPAVAAVLLEAFYDTAGAAGAASATVVTNPLAPSGVFHSGRVAYDCRDERIGQFTVFPTGAAASSLINLFDDPRPRNIRRAERAGVTVESNREAPGIGFLAKTHAANMGAIGGLAKRQRFFESVPDSLHEDEWNLYCGMVENVPVAALLLFYFNHTVEYYTPVVDASARSTQALSLVIYRAMQDAVDRGFVRWNWGGTWRSQKGVYDFKKRWGTTDHPYHYFTRVFNPDVRRQARETLLAGYPGFYVVPFGALDRPVADAESL